VASRLVPYRNMWRAVACESPGTKTFDVLDHGFGDEISSARLARVPSASTMIPALLSMR
jgi:hypothetical protein